MPPPNDEGKQDDEGSAAGTDVNQQLSKLQEELGALKQEKKQLADEKVSLASRLDEADKELLSDTYLTFKEKVSGGSGSGSGSGSGDIDLDRASNKEVVDFVRKEFGGNISAAVKSLKGELELTKQQTSILAAQFDVSIASLKHDGRDGKPSFEENFKDIMVVAKENPTWNAEKCYKQFVIQSKAKAEEKAAIDAKKAEDEERAFSEKAGSPDSVVVGKQPTADEAAKLAYRQAFGNKK